MEHKFYMMVVCWIGGSPPPYIALQEWILG